ncbi:39S ribosomal protein L18, mitochondrial [Aricia agestis]|uniref:39S ribosomal protein L18, mitochondrial n=1 Tax=Aricia agestis TaxID=91739 RepID=UPI001C20810A|nr:39S ribosomal protein L18, mitochondrial [Aricia agestis]
MLPARNTALISNIIRCMSSSPAEFVNRNPRNLERMRIARKPDGYHLEKPGRKFWHKLVLTPSNRTIKAEVVHFINGPVITAQTSEWAIRSQLYSITDTCAYMNLGRVFAQRCLESGITEMFCDLEAKEGGKVDIFLKELVKGGVRLQEMDVYKNPYPTDEFRPEKPWEVTEE